MVPNRPSRFLEDVTKKQIVVFLILAPHKLEEKKSDHQQIGVSKSGFLRNSTVANVLPLRPKQTRTGSNFYRFIVTGDGNRVKNIILHHIYH